MTGAIAAGMVDGIGFGLLGDTARGQRPKRVDVLGEFVAQSLTSNRRGTQQ